MPTDAQLAVFAKAVLLDVAEMAADPRDRARAAISLVEITTPKDVTTNEDALDKLAADELAKLQAQAEGEETRQ